MELLFVVVAVLVIAGLVWWLNRVRTERDDALADLNAVTNEHLQLCYLLEQGTGMYDQAVRNARAAVARHEGNEPDEDEGGSEAAY